MLVFRRTVILLGVVAFAASIDITSASAECSLSGPPTSVMKSINKTAEIISQGKADELDQFAEKNFQAIGAGNQPLQNKESFKKSLDNIKKNPFASCNIYAPIINVYGNFATGTFALVLYENKPASARPYTVMYPLIVLRRATEDTPWSLQELHISLIRHATDVSLK